MATFFSVFPGGTVWGNDLAGLRYDVVLLGSAEPVTIDVDALETKLRRPDFRNAAASLREVGFRSGSQLLATYAGDAPSLGIWLKDAVLNRDRNLRLQYLAGLGLNLSQGMFIYDDVLSRRRYPRGLYLGSPKTLEALRKAAGLGP
jgi:spermidine synthase